MNENQHTRASAHTHTRLRFKFCTELFAFHYNLMLLNRHDFSSSPLICLFFILDKTSHLGEGKRIIESLFIPNKNCITT